MQYRSLSEGPKTYALIFETGDELATGLSRFAAERKLAGSSFKAIGAFSSVKLACQLADKEIPTVCRTRRTGRIAVVGRRCCPEGQQSAGSRLSHYWKI
jgi:predicted DNA-binding protein with PD1-like motif